MTQPARPARTLPSMLQEGGVIVVPIMLAFAHDALESECRLNLSSCEEVCRYHFQ